MIIKINVGGVEVYFGYPGSPVKPEPFYPYLIDVEQIIEANGQETASTSFQLSLKAKGLIGLNMRRATKIYNDNMFLQFEGLLSNLRYSSTILVGLEA